MAGGIYIQECRLVHIVQQSRSAYRRPASRPRLTFQQCNLDMALDSLWLGSVRQTAYNKFHRLPMVETVEEQLVGHPHPT